MNANPTPFVLRSAADMVNRQKPDWIIDNIFTAGGFAVLCGAPGSGKPFLALDWALSVATGAPWWMEQAVHAGHVVYVAEDTYSLRKRINAWISAHNIEPANVNMSFITQLVRILEPADVDALISAIETVNPTLIIIDPLARAMIGGDENSARDIGLFIAGIDRIRRTTNATVLVVHDTDKQADPALWSAADTMIEAGARNNVISIACYQKNFVSSMHFNAQLALHADSCIITRSAKTTTNR